MKDTNSDLAELIFTLSRLMRSRMGIKNNLSTLSLLQIQTLLFLEKNTNAHMSDISQQFAVELPSATSLIQKLVTTRLAVRRQDKDDRRLVLINLTAKGKNILQKVAKDRKKKINENLSVLSIAEKNQLKRILGKIIKKVEAYEK